MIDVKILQVKMTDLEETLDADSSGAGDLALTVLRHCLIVPGSRFHTASRC